jgi:ribosomal protein S18 acetylase RimI-like enzyme
VITLVPVSLDNALALKDARLRALQDTPSAFGSTYARESQFTDAEWVERAERWTTDGSAAYLAMNEGAACGIVAGYLDGDDATRAHLVSMWVAPAHRRAGVGRSLVDAVLAWARTHGAHTVLLLVTSNNDSAIAFYRRLGFTMTGRTEPYPNDPTLFEYEMSRPVP